MRHLCFLFLFQLVITGKLIGQHPFDQQHEKFIRLHRSADAATLSALLQTEEKLFRQKQPTTSNVHTAKLALDRGIYYYMTDEYPKCIASFERAVQLNCLTSNRDKILLYTYLGVSYRNELADFTKAHTCLDKAIVLATKEKGCDLLASALIKKTDTYYYQGRFQQGTRLLEPFLREKGNRLSTDRKISIHARLAEGYDKAGVYSNCYVHYTAAIELARTTNDRRLISDQYHNFAHYFLNKSRYTEAKGLVLQVIRLLKDKPGSERDLNNSYAVLAQIYSSLHKPDSALYYAGISRDHALKTGDYESLSVAHATLGHIYGDLKEYATALDYLLKAAAYEEQYIGISNLADIYHNIGVVYLHMHRYRQSIAYLEKSNKHAYLAGDIYTLQLNYDDLAKAYRGAGDPEQVIAMKDSAFLYYDSLNNIENNKELLRLETRYETKLKEQENKLLKLEVKRQNDLTEKERQARRNTLLLSLILILLLLGVVYILFIKNRLKKSKVAEATLKIRHQKLEEELLLQRLNSLTDEINRKNQLIQSLENGAGPIAEESLINKVTLENDWLAFMSEFDKMHHGYLGDLKHRFPALTTNNLRIAALVKLGFSNKEIAHIMCITENGVKKAKQRLKERTTPA